jgi:hypothetical protein
MNPSELDRPTTREIPGPDMTAPIVETSTWFLTPDSPAEFVIDILEIESGSTTIPMVAHFPGLRPQEHIRRGREDMTPDHDEFHETTLAANSHIDAILLLSGGAFSGVDRNRILGGPAGTDIRNALTTPNNAEARSDKLPDEEFIVDTILVRQFRRVTATHDGTPSNISRVREERCARLYRTYGADGTPSREVRIANLLSDGIVFARVQAHNLSLPVSPRQDLRKTSI